MKYILSVVMLVPLALAATVPGAKGKGAKDSARFVDVCLYESNFCKVLENATRPPL